jgi:hypothetical protein
MGANLKLIRHSLALMALVLALCAPSEALAEESDSLSEPMRGSLSVGYNVVEDANSYAIEVDFTFVHVFAGVGFFMIDNGNLPSGLKDSPPPSGVSTVDVGRFNDNETGGYIKCGGVLSGLRLFGMIGASDVTSKYVVKSTLSDFHYVTEEETGNFTMLYGAGIGYLLFNRVLLQYQYDNRRENLIMVGLSF